MTNSFKQLNRTYKIVLFVVSIIISIGLSFQTTVSYAHHLETDEEVLGMLFILSLITFLVFWFICFIVLELLTNLTKSNQE